MVDAETVAARLTRLDQLLEQLDQVHAAGPDAYAADFRTRLAAQHALQLAIQACIDVGAHLIAASDLQMPSDYRGVFAALVPAGIDADLATRLGHAAGMRNILVHDYLDLDDRLVWEALGDLADLRSFAAFAAALE